MKIEVINVEDALVAVHNIYKHHNGTCHGFCDDITAEFKKSHGIGHCGTAL